MKFKPTRYDPGTRTVHSEHGCIQGKATEASFIEKALIYARRYGQAEWLQWAIEQGLPGLQESEEAREALSLLARNKSLRKRGDRSSVNLASDARRLHVLSRVWFHHGRGLPVYINPESNSSQLLTACAAAAAEESISASRAHQIWLDAGGHDPSSAALEIVRVLCMADGKQSR
jgi:hypothetical protein